MIIVFNKYSNQYLLESTFFSRVHVHNLINRVKIHSATHLK